jgi:hypothetical protein
LRRTQMLARRGDRDEHHGIPSSDPNGMP